jgi:hypothetical protein
MTLKTTMATTENDRLHATELQAIGYAQQIRRNIAVNKHLPPGAPRRPVPSREVLGKATEWRKAADELQMPYIFFAVMLAKEGIPDYDTAIAMATAMMMIA